MLKAEIPKDKKKLERQIDALAHLVSTDTSDLDRKVHEDALRALEKERDAYYG